MKKSIYAILACGLAAAGALLTGCSTIEVETTEWKAKIHSHWFQREMSGFSVDRKADGGYAIKVNEVKGDVSERLPEFTREMWAGLGFLGQLAAATINPAASQGAGQSPVLSNQTTSACKGGNCTDPDCKGGNCDAAK